MASERERDEVRDPGAGSSVASTYTAEEADFLKAMECYKRTQRRPFPTCREVLMVLKSLGYRRVEEARELPKFDRTPGRRYD